MMPHFPPRRSRRARHTPGARFTFMEVLIALGILALALAATLTICSESGFRLQRARERWALQHALDQAVEYGLLCSPKATNIPREVLPEGFSASCEIEAVQQNLPDLPDYAREPLNGWVLARYRITLRDAHGGVLAVQTVDKMVPEVSF